jgi:hypothetical protein
MNEFRDTLGNFRDAMHAEGEGSVSPDLPAILHREHVAKGFRLRWVVAAVAVMLTLGAIPVYQQEQKQREAAQDESDRVLMEQVNAGLARSVSPAMEPLMRGN